MKRPTISVAVLGLVLAFSCGGGGGGDGGVVVSAPSNVAGQWLATVNESRDTCGIDLVDTAVNYYFINQTGSDVQVLTHDYNGTCDVYNATISGNTVRYSRTDTTTFEGCTLRIDINILWNVSGTHMSGSTKNHVSYVSGNCDGFSACDWDLSVVADICNGCWPGCPLGVVSSRSKLAETIRESAKDRLEAR